TLAERLQKGPLPLVEALEIGVAVSSALGEAHARGIVHRDVKPGNIMLTRTGAKLLDFGIAQMAGASFAEGVAAGTVPYTAPEQWDGQADSRSDVFAVGAVLAEMITGHKAFPQGPHQPPGPFPMEPLAPAPLVRILRTCLEPDLARRWQSAADLS